MKAQPHAEAVPLERRRQLLRGVPGFGALPAELIDDLARSLRDESFAAGTVVVAEGELGDCLYLIEQGQAKVSTYGATAAVSLAVLEPGDLFGEIALLTPNRRRQATVAALTPLRTLVLSAKAFAKALDASPEARVDIAAVADTLLTAKFLKQQGSWRGAADGPARTS